MQRSYQMLIGSFVALAMLFAISSFRPVSADTTEISDPPADEVAVKLKPGVAIATILTRYNATLLGSVAETKLYFLKLSNGQSASQLLPTLNADTDLFYAEPNYYTDGSPDGKVIFFRAHWSPQGEVIFFRAHEDATSTPGGEQWAWDKIKLNDAKKMSNGQGIIVAVLDTGMAPDHDLLKSSITAGYDFVGMTNSIYDAGNNLDDDGDGLVDEEMGHGTHVSGIIITEAPGVQIMPIRVLNSDGVGTYWEVAAGIRYAVDHGAKIINLSLSAPRLTPSLSAALDYAAAHNVLVVSAAGTGSGPNYPAAHPNVIGVGASDQADAPAWFSGGQPSDTDVFAPGMDIYSAYPYDNYVAGSGTSMAAPMVAAEAALLMARYPDWDAVKVAQRIRAHTAPVSGQSAGRIDLASAMSTGFVVKYNPGDGTSATDNQIRPHIFLVNNTTQDIPLSQFKLRYWHTSDSQAQVLECDYASLGCSALTSIFVPIPTNSLNRTPLSDTYLEMGFNSQAGNLPAGVSAEYTLRIHKTNWENYNEADDYSYEPSYLPAHAWEKITLLRNGALVWGTEPTSSQSTALPTQTNTAIAAATSTQAALPSQTPAPTQTYTATPLPTATQTATVAPTATPIATQTSIPATATQAAAGSSIKLKYIQAVTASSHQIPQVHFQLYNTGAVGIPLNEIKVRYWYTVDGEIGQSFACDYSWLGCGNIMGQFVQLSSPRNGSDYYMEVGFTSNAGVLAPGGTTELIQTRMNKNNWSYYTQTNDYSFDAAKTQLSETLKITVYWNGVLVWGVEP